MKKPTVEENRGLVYKVFNTRFSKYRYIEEDLIQEGLIALWTACEKFDASRGLAFSTFAVTCIKNAMLNYLAKERRYRSNTTSGDTVLDEEIGEATILDTLEDTRAEDFEEKVLLAEVLEIAKETGHLEIIRLKLEGYSQKEIADIFKVTPSAISARCRVFYKIARKKLLKD